MIIDIDSNYFIRNTIIIFASISLLSDLFIVICYINFKVLRKSFAFQLILYLTISNILTMIGRYLVFPTGDNLENENILCKFQGLLINYGMLSSLLWVDIFSHSLYSVIVKNNKNIENNHFVYLMIGFVLPLVFSLVPLYMDYYGPAGKWC